MRPPPDSPSPSSSGLFYLGRAWELLEKRLAEPSLPRRILKPSSQALRVMGMDVALASVLGWAWEFEQGSDVS